MARTRIHEINDDGDDDDDVDEEEVDVDGHDHFIKLNCDLVDYG